MKTIKFLSVLLTLSLLSATAIAQKIHVSEGNLKPLKGQSTLNVKYDYSDMSVGDYEREQDYLDERIKERNKSEAGAGDEWARKWVADREERFEPKFEELINKELGGKMEVGAYPDAKYTLIVATTHTEPGFNVGVWRKNAHINTEIWVVETANPETVIAKLEMQKVPGRDIFGYDFDTGLRLQEAYAKCGKEMGKLIAKAL